MYLYFDWTFSHCVLQLPVMCVIDNYVRITHICLAVLIPTILLFTHKSHIFNKLILLTDFVVIWIMCDSKTTSTYTLDYFLWCYIASVIGSSKTVTEQLCYISHCQESGKEISYSSLGKHYTHILNQESLNMKHSEYRSTFSNEEQTTYPYWERKVKSYTW